MAFVGTRRALIAIPTPMQPDTQPDNPDEWRVGLMGGIGFGPISSITEEIIDRRTGKIVRVVNR